MIWLFLFSTFTCVDAALCLFVFLSLDVYSQCCMDALRDVVQWLVEEKKQAAVSVIIHLLCISHICACELLSEPLVSTSPKLLLKSTKSLSIVVKNRLWRRVLCNPRFVEFIFY